MRLISYKRNTSDGNVATHYVNLDRVEHFSLPADSMGDVTELYAVIGENVHVLSEGKKILNPLLLLSRMLDLADRSKVNISELIDDCNKFKSKK